MRYNGRFFRPQTEAVLFLHPADKRIYVQLWSQPSSTSCLLSSVRRPKIYRSTTKARNHSPVCITKKYKSLVLNRPFMSASWDYPLNTVRRRCWTVIAASCMNKSADGKKEIKNQRKKMWISHIYKRLLYRSWSKLESSRWWRGRN